MPAAWIAVPLLAGASAGVFLVEVTPDRLILATAFAALLSVMAGLAFFLDEFSAGALACVVGGALLSGYSMGVATVRSLLAPPLLVWFEALQEERTDPVVLEGVLREDAARVPYGVLLTMDVEAAADLGSSPEQLSGGARLVVAGAAPAEERTTWRAGRTIRVAATLRRPTTFSDPGVEDERLALAQRRVSLTGSVKSAALVEVISRGSRLDECAAAVRAWTRDVLEQHVGRIDARSAAIATAILIGDRTGLSDQDERRLKDAGTYHVIAISGGNIAILTMLLVCLARAVKVRYRTSAVSAMAILLFYGEVAGGAASVGRAITAAVLFLAALALDHRGAPLNVLAVAALLALAVHPMTTIDGGFLLSFGATAGIVVGVPLLIRFDRSRERGFGRRMLRGSRTATLAMLAATVCAETVLAPISASLFSRVTFAGLLLNFAAIPLMTAVQCGSLALLASELLGAAAAAPLGRLVHWCAWTLVETSSVVEYAPWLARDVPPPAAWVCAVYYASGAAVVFLPRHRRLSAVALMMAAGLLLSGVAPAVAGRVPDLPSGSLRVVVLDVGQGDATVAILPDRRAVLVDAGGLAGTTFDMGARVVIPALRALGVRDLHALVLTHGDPDHIGGAQEVLRSVAVSNVWEGVPVPSHPALGELRALAAERRIVWRTVRPTDVERAGGVEIRVHHPPEPEWERQRVRNDDSVVLEFRYGDVSVLLPGDIGPEGERAISPHLSASPVVVLKAAHHGSATSSGEAFLDAARPDVVIFSAGRNNRFGHPAPAVVNRFVRRGVEMFNTAEDGAVFVDTDGSSVTVSGWRGGRVARLSRKGEEHD